MECSKVNFGKNLNLRGRDGSRLALKLERMGIIYREKILEKGSLDLQTNFKENSD